LNENDICLGCFRSLAEIIDWNTATEQQKKEIIKKAKIRAIKHN